LNLINKIRKYKKRKLVIVKRKTKRKEEEEKENLHIKQNLKECLKELI